MNTFVIPQILPRPPAGPVYAGPVSGARPRPGVPPRPAIPRPTATAPAAPSAWIGLATCGQSRSTPRFRAFSLREETFGNGGIGDRGLPTRAGRDAGQHGLEVLDPQCHRCQKSLPEERRLETVEYYGIGRMSLKRSTRKGPRGLLLFDGRLRAGAGRAGVVALKPLTGPA